MIDPTTEAKNDPAQPPWTSRVLSSPCPPAPAEQTTARKYDGGGSSKKTPIRIGAVVVVALAVGLRHLAPAQGRRQLRRAQRRRRRAAAVGAPSTISEAGLKQLAADGATLYPAGPEGWLYVDPRHKLERLVLRSLPPARRGGHRPDPASLVVATYPFENAWRPSSVPRRTPDSVSTAIADGGIAVYSKSSRRTSTSPTRIRASRSRSTIRHRGTRSSSSRQGLSRRSPRRPHPLPATR